MSCETEISLQIEKLKTVFQRTVIFCSEHSNINSILHYLEDDDVEFRSVAYEAASTVIASNDLLNNSISNWKLFEEQSPKHTPQIYAGLGWAFAKENHRPLDYFSSLPELWRFRVLDGYGYYDGVFRQKQSILSKKIPHEFENEKLLAYDQGLGRSIWYKHKTDLQKITETISQFPISRQGALWRGIGVASTYVGGTDVDFLHSLFLTAGKYKTQLNFGIALAVQSRHQSDTMTKFTEQACNIGLNRSIEEISALMGQAEFNFKENKNYLRLLSEIETKLSESNLTNPAFSK